MRYDVMHVQLVQHGVRILGGLDALEPWEGVGSHIITDLAETRREHHHLINLPHPLQKVIHAWTLDNIDVVPMIFDLNGDYIVSLLYRLYRPSRTSVDRSKRLKRPRTAYLKAAVH